MKNEVMMYYVAQIERAHDRDCAKQAKLARQRRAVHHDNNRKVRDSLTKDNIREVQQ